MLAGATLGWDKLAAKLWNCEPDGTPRNPPKKRRAGMVKIPARHLS
jgi:hypothetical protein